MNILYDRVLHFYEVHDRRVECILTDDSREYYGRAMIHPYDIFLQFNDITHRPKGDRSHTNSFVERSNRTVLDEFFRETFRTNIYASMNKMQKDVDGWLHYYKYEKPRRGYRNMGKKPIETVKEGKAIKE